MFKDSYEIILETDPLDLFMRSKQVQLLKSEWI